MRFTTWEPSIPNAITWLCIDYISTSYILKTSRWKSENLDNNEDCLSTGLVHNNLVQQVTHLEQATFQPSVRYQHKPFFFAPLFPCGCIKYSCSPVSKLSSFLIKGTSSSPVESSDPYLCRKLYKCHTCHTCMSSNNPDANGLDRCSTVQSYMPGTIIITNNESTVHSIVHTMLNYESMAEW